MTTSLTKIWQTKNLISLLLWPFSWLYLACHIINYYLLQQPKKVGAKVICIGNLTVGGSGKTPYAIYLAQQKIKEGCKVAFISKGYKGKLVSSTVALKVEPKQHSATDVGDEPILLAEYAPTYVSHNRYIGALAAAQEGADLIIMDDGLQNNTLYKDEIILVFDTLNGIGNGYMLPAGPMREPLKMGLSKINQVILIGDHKHDLEFPHKTRLIPAISNIARISKQQCILITGIANSNRLVNMLKSNEVTIIKHFDFPDHYQFTEQDYIEVEKFAAHHSNTILITTRKDYNRMTSYFQTKCTVLEYQLHSAI